MGKEQMMINRIMTIVLSALLLAAAPRHASAADMYAVDPTHCSVVFSVAHSGFSFVYGFFRQAAGNYILDETNPANCRFRFAIQADSIDTNSAERDKHLRSADFFNVQQYPTITFDSTSCQRASTPDGGVVYQVTGDLTLHGVKKQVTLPLRLLGAGEGPFKDQRSGFLTQFELKRSDFGMTTALEKNLVGDAVSITISFEGVLQQNQNTQPGSR
jgi:polyisoprenoid-binding protein YceI